MALNSLPSDGTGVGPADRSVSGRLRATILSILISITAAAGKTHAAEPSPYHPNRILVMAREGKADDLSRFHTAEGRVAPTTGNLQVVQLAAGEKVEDAVNRYLASGLVSFAEPDYAVTTASTFPSDPFFQNGTQWALNNYGQNGGLPDADIDAPEAWDVRRFASNVVVAVIDSGIRLTHEDFAGNLWTNPSDGTHGFNALTSSHDPVDDNGHGTHVAGIIGATGDNAKGVVGVAWKVRIMACKFLDSIANGFNSDAVTCIEFARTNGAHILNLSWGGSEYSAAVSNAIALARSDGIIVVAAAGNNARNTDVTPYYPANIQLENIVSVGASTRLDSLWFSSNFGQASVDLFAPGAAIYSTTFNTDSSYGNRDGSSMATAQVSGAFALLRQHAPGTASIDLIRRMLATVDYAPAFSNKCATGGRLNLRKSLDQPSLVLDSSSWPIQMRIIGVPGHSYRLAASTNLVSWVPLQTNVSAANGDWVFVETNSANQVARFYRAEPAP